MKPKLVVKTTKGHRYLQLLDLHGNLIHIGNAEKLENWCVAINALQYNYEGLAYQEALKLDHEKVVQCFKQFQGDHRQTPEAWKKYCEKRIQGRVNHEFFVKIYNNIPEDQAIQELVDYRTNLEIKSKISNDMLMSPDVFELISLIHKELAAGGANEGVLEGVVGGLPEMGNTVVTHNSGVAGGELPDRSGSNELTLVPFGTKVGVAGGGG
jgi:hypothetical protein